MEYTNGGISAEWHPRKGGGMNMKEVSAQPVTQLIATFTACKQVGPESWDVYPVSQLFAASATIADIAAWFHKQNPKVTKIENIHLHQPEECDKAQTSERGRK